jgi:methylmalonyl-CoA mutase cobalamin-binding subunit
LNSVREILQDQGERRPETPATESTESENEADGDSGGAIDPRRTGLCVLCLPARTEADEIAGTMLAQLLDLPGCRVEVAPVASSASELIDLVRQLKPRVVCISALPPAAVMHARTLCKRLRGRIPAGNLVVGLWHAQGDLNKAKERIGCGADAHVVTTLADAQEQIRLLLADAAEVQLPPVAMKDATRPLALPVLQG